jgi:hypothetical protein
MTSIATFLTGTWFICFSNFPMWTKGNKTNLTFNYAVAETSPKLILSDDVRYLKNGKQKSIKGLDTQSSENPNAFKWRGKGFLKIASSNWEVVFKDEEQGQWAVIYFSKTLFTPEGVDIISRTEELSPEMLKEINEKIKADPMLAKHFPSIRRLAL